MSDRPDDPDREALRRAQRVAPERPASEVVTLRQGGDLSPDYPGDRAAAEDDADDEVEDDEVDDDEVGEDEVGDDEVADDPEDDEDDEEDDDVEAAEDATLEDWEAADAARPTLDDETDDGLSDTDEEVRRQAEDPVSTERSRRR